MRDSNFPLYSIYYYLLFLIVLFFGIYIRFDDVKFWKENQNLAFYKGEPLYAEYDSFYFARLALDLKEGLFKSGEIDKFRFFPDNSSEAKLNEKETFAPKYSVSGHLISYLFYWLSLLTGMSVSWLTYYLIPFMAISVAIPLYFYFNHVKLPLAGILGGLITVSAPMYLGRTGLMRLDHDVFNLTFPFLIAYFFYRFFQSHNLRGKYIWIGLASLSLLLYQLWYAHGNLNFVLVLTFFIAYLWDPIKKFIISKKFSLSFTREDYIFMAILLLPQLWYLYTGPYYLYLQVKTLVFNIKSPTAADILFKDFPNIFQSISELQKLEFWEVFGAVIYNRILGLISLLGAFLLFLFNFRSLIFLFPFFVIGLLTFFSGARFAMYLAPFLGLGLGYLVHFSFEKLLPYLDQFKEPKKQKLSTAIVGFLVFATALISQREALSMVSTPKITAPLVRDMEWLKEKTPKEAIIWTWWDYGYAFHLYARRATIHDGGTQASPKTYLVARSFATSDPKEAWLITSFVSNQGLTGLAKILKNENITAKEVMEKIRTGHYYQEIKSPIYWVFTEDLIAKFGWIHFFGSYNFDKKEGIFGKIMVPACKVLNPQLLQCPELNNALIDLNLGLIRVENQSVPIKNFYIQEPNQLIEKNFYPQGYTVAIVRAGNQTGLILAEPPSDESLFFKMFILRKYDSQYFELVYDNFPQMVVYRVKAK